MGLYGVLVVTDANYPGQTFDKDVALLLSEIDPVQNTAVDTAVRTAGFSDALVWSGQTGKCGDPAVHTCYPPAVNYNPRYYLINGVSFDRSNSASSALAVPRRRHLGARVAALRQRRPAHARALGRRREHDAAGRGRQQAAGRAQGAERSVPRRRQDL